MHRSHSVSVPAALLVLAGALTAQGGFGQQGPKDRFAIVHTTAAPTLLSGTTDTYVQDFTHAGLENFKAAIFFVSGAESANTTTATARLSVGFCDHAGNQAFRSGLAIDDVNFQQTGYQKAPLAVIGVPTATAVNRYAARGAFHSVITNGVRIQWTRTVTGDTDPTSIEPYRITCLLIGGVGAQTKAFVGADGNAAPGNHSFTDTGFEADFYVFIGFLGAINVEGNDNHAFSSFGFVANRTGLPQAALSYAFPDDPTGPPHHPPAELSESVGVMRTDRAVSIYDIAEEDENLVQVTDITSSGFDYTTNDSTGFFFLGVKLADEREVNVVVESLPASTGSESFTGLGFEPEIVLTASNLLTSTNTIVGTADGVETTTGGHGYSVFSSSTHDGALSVSNADGLLLGHDPLQGHEQSVTRSRAGAKALLVLPNNPLVDSDPAVEAELESMDNNGFTLDFTCAEDGRMLVLGIEKFLGSPLTAGSPRPLAPGPILPLSALVSSALAACGLVR
jgi:hypothetical protein